jgi:hypothetical protein
LYNNEKEQFEFHNVPLPTVSGRHEALIQVNDNNNNNNFNNNNNNNNIVVCNGQHCATAINATNAYRRRTAKLRCIGAKQLALSVVCVVV